MEQNNKFNLVDYHFRSQQEVVVSYKGPFDKGAMNMIGNYIRGLISMNPQASKKVFKVFIELAQNIAQYSAEKNIIGEYVGAGVGSLVIVAGTLYTMHRENLKKRAAPTPPPPPPHELG